MDLATFDLSTQPPLVDRKTGAELISRYGFPVSPRTLEAWPLDWYHVNGKALCQLAQLFAVAQAKLDAAPRTRITCR